MGYYNIHKEGSEGIETGRDAFANSLNQIPLKT